MSYHNESAPQNPPFGWSPANPLLGTLSPGEQWVWTGGGWEENTDFVYANPIIEVDLQATANDNFYFQSNPDEQYVGPYHRHEDGTLMIGGGELGVNHDMISDEIIFRKIGYQDIQETRERVSDIFYKVWFESNTLSEEEILSMQTTIRDGIKQTGRTEDEPLVFYKKDRNTLESRKDLEGDKFEEMCQYIYSNQIDDLDGRFDILVTDLQLGETEHKRWSLRFRKNDSSFIGIQIAVKVDGEFIDVINLSQLTKPKTSTRVNPEKARDVLDTNIFELLPNQTTRQDTINSFFNQFNELIGPKPAFDDVDGDGAGEVAVNYDQDEQNRISYENRPTAYITRLDKQAEGDTNNQGKTLESMRNKLNTYLGDTDNVIDTLEDNRPEYENISEGFLKIRKPNQAIILRSPNNNQLEFQRVNPTTGKPSYLEDGFTITMWVKFVSKTSEGTLFNFGNPLNSNSMNSSNAKGFRLDTKVNLYNGKYYRYIRLIVRDWTNTSDAGGRMYRIRDNNFGTPALARFDHRSFGTNESNYLRIHEAFPQVSTDDLDEWYFICATFNPNIAEPDYIQGSPLLTNTQYWLNHILPTSNGNVVVANSGQGAKCKVEIISRSDLLNARGYIGKPLTVVSQLEESLDIQSSFTYQIVEDETTSNNNPPVANFEFEIIG